MRITPLQLGKIIRGVRKKLGLTQKQLALTAGIGLRFLIELENGKESCQLGKALRVINTLGIEMLLEPPPLISAEEYRR